jgi:hypothetical protein
MTASYEDLAAAGILDPLRAVWSDVAELSRLGELIHVASGTVEEDDDASAPVGVDESDELRNAIFGASPRYYEDEADEEVQKSVGETDEGAAEGEA